jgi:hypothetical protein
LWSLAPESIEQLQPGGTSLRLPHATLFCLLSYGDDPQIHLPALPGRQTGIIVAGTIRINRGTSALPGLLQPLLRLRNETAEEGTAEAVVDRRLDLRQRVDRSAAERENLSRQLHLACTETARLRAQVAELQNALGLISEDRDRTRTSFLAIRRSWSWRLSAPLRLLGGLFVRASP